MKRIINFDAGLLPLLGTIEITACGAPNNSKATGIDVGYDS